MTITEERTLLALWHRYRTGKPVANQTMIDFYFDLVRQEPKLKHCNAFEVFDSITNPVAVKASA